MEEIQEIVCSYDENLWELQMLAGHWAHEIGHSLDLFHTYDGNNDGIGPSYTTWPETNVISNFDFLSDVFDLNDPNGNSSFCNPNPGLICYHQNDGPGGCGNPAFQNDLVIDGLPNLCHVYGTNNLMGNFNINRGYISPLQVAKVQRALSLKSVRKYVTGSPYDSHPIEISSNQTWNMDIQLYNDIIVKSGNTLTIQCRVALPDQARIVVEPGAVLYLDGGTLTGFHEMWQGVRLLGDASASQGTFNLDGSGVPVLDANGYPIVSSSQGVVLMHNGTIENAEEGIFIGAGFGDLEYNKTGGIVYAKNSIFRNNFRDVAFNPYKYSLKSKFIECEFITDDHLKNPDYFDATSNTWAGTQGHVSLWGVRDLEFIDNTFVNDLDYEIKGECPNDIEVKDFFRRDRGDGIGSFDSRYLIRSTDPENPTTPLRNEFLGLTRGVWSRHTIPMSNQWLRVKDAYFENVQFGILSENTGNDLIHNNKFLIPDGQGSYPTIGINYEPYGIMEYKYRAANIAGNSFESMASSGYFNWGSIFETEKSLPSSSFVSENSYEGVLTSVQAQVTAPAIQFECNSFTNTLREWNLFPDDQSIDPQARLFRNQGTGCQSNEERVANYFYDEGEHIWSNANNDWRYYNRGNIVLETPTFADDVPNGLGDKADCPGTLVDPCLSSSGGGNLGIGIMHARRGLIETQKDSIELDLATFIEDNNERVQVKAWIADTTLALDTLLNKLTIKSPLSDSSMVEFIQRQTSPSSSQMLSLLSKNLPCPKLVWDSLAIYLDSDRKYDSIRDSLAKLQVENPYQITRTELVRSKIQADGSWQLQLGAIVQYYAEQDSLSALIPLYKDSLANRGFEKELIGAYLTLDSVSFARNVLDSLVLIDRNDTLFATYTDLYLEMIEDTITWLQLDSVQKEKLESLSREESIIQNYALAARALRGDTTYHRYPQLEEVVSSRIANTVIQQEKKQESRNDIKLYPNPNQGNFNLEIFSDKRQTISIDIVDVTGRLILNKTCNLIENKNVIQIDLQNVHPGIYFVNVYNEQGVSLGTKRNSYIK